MAKSFKKFRSEWDDEDDDRRRKEEKLRDRRNQRHNKWNDRNSALKDDDEGYND